MSKKWTADNVQVALKEIKIASPCKVSISEMEDRGSCFHCHECKLNVYHFSTLTNTQIAELLNQNTEKRCIGFFRREDGTVITKDCPLGIKDIGLVYRRQGLWRSLTFAFFILTTTSFALPFKKDQCDIRKNQITHPEFIIKNVWDALSGPVNQGAEKLE